MITLFNENQLYSIHRPRRHLELYITYASVTLCVMCVVGRVTITFDVYELSLLSKSYIDVSESR